MGIETDVRNLATDMGREVGTAGHDDARSYILDRIHDMGIAPYLPGGFEASYSSDDQEFSNILATVPGKDPSLSPVLLGAHYDTCDSLPGADDNATTVAVLLEVAAWIKGRSNRQVGDLRVLRRGGAAAFPVAVHGFHPVL